jgi:hypothetical protein
VSLGRGGSDDTAKLLRNSNTAERSHGTSASERNKLGVTAKGCYYLTL